MHVHSITALDGSAVVVIDGARQKITGKDLADARRQVLAVVRARAAHHDEEVTLTSSDPDGTWTVIVTPDGIAHDPAEPRPFAPAAPATPPRRGRTRPTKTRLAKPAKTRAKKAETPATPVAAVQSPPPAPETPTPPAPETPTPPQWTPPALPEEAEATILVPPRPVHTGPTLTLTFDNGEEARITGAAFVGRRPTNNASIPAQLVTVRDDTRNLSRTHFLIVWSGDQAGIVDQESANGTVIERDGHVPITAQPGRTATLLDGDRLLLGDRTAVVSIDATMP